MAKYLVQIPAAVDAHPVMGLMAEAIGLGPQLIEISTNSSGFLCAADNYLICSSDAGMLLGMIAALAP